MKKTNIRITFAVLFLLWALQPVALAQPAEAGSGTSKLTGKVLSADGKPVAGVTVVAYHLSTETVYTSTATKVGGEYVIRDMPYGYFDLGVETGEGLFVGNRVINLPPAGEAAVIFTLTPYVSTSPGGQAREFPGSDRPSSGMAEVRERPRGREFWRSPRGVAILAGSGGAALLAIAGGGGSSSGAASPFTP